MVDGNTTLIAHLGYPTSAFKASMIYNLYFDKIGVNAIVVPMGVRSQAYAEFLFNLFKLTNIRGALVTMPHKIATLSLVDEVSVTARIAGACNAILLRDDGTLLGDMFDVQGFISSLIRKGRSAAGARALVVGNGGVGSAIAASLAKAGVAALGLFDVDTKATSSLVERLQSHYPSLEISGHSSDPKGYDIIVNATPLGMKEGDPLPIDVNRISKFAFVGEVVMTREVTPFLAATAARAARRNRAPICCLSKSPRTLNSSGFLRQRRMSLEQSRSLLVGRLFIPGDSSFCGQQPARSSLAAAVDPD